jgi:anti-sigma B factor antagonist
MNFVVTENTHFTLVTSKVDKLDASNASDLKNELIILNKKGINSIVIDLSATKYCDSSGLSAILVANRLCKDTNGRFALSGLQANVTKMIAISQLDKVLSITASIEEATALMAN